MEIEDQQDHCSKSDLSKKEIKSRVPNICKAIFYLLKQYKKRFGSIR